MRSPFGLIHDAARAVRVFVDSDLRAAERLIFHPNDNTASLTISGADFTRFLVQKAQQDAEKSIMDALTALLPFSPRDVQDKKRSLDRWLHW